PHEPWDIPDGTHLEVRRRDQVFSSRERTTKTLLDLNGDGRLDRVVAAQTNAGGGNWIIGQWTVYLQADCAGTPCFIHDPAFEASGPIDASITLTNGEGTVYGRATVIDHFDVNG